MPSPIQPPKRKKRRCRCCRHDEPHCTCRFDRVKPPPPGPITVRPNAGSIFGWLNLAQIAYIIGRATKLPVTVPWVSGAIRVLQLGLDKKPRPARVRGIVLFRQQTMVHPTQLPRIQHYIQERYS